jgi:hypothetical protein
MSENWNRSREQIHKDQEMPRKMAQGETMVRPIKEKKMKLCILIICYMYT